MFNGPGLGVEVLLDRVESSTLRTQRIVAGRSSHG
jgi:hypothetical protein